MIQVLGNLKGLLKSKRTCIDHMVFRLHYKFTVLLLLVFCIMVTTKQYGGDPIKCTRNSKEFSEVADSYCYITTTFTSKSAYNISLYDKVPYPGIKYSDNEEDRRYHIFYQWVGFILFLEAVCFYFPHWLWKTLEDNKVEWLVSGIDEKFYLKDEMSTRREVILSYLRKSWGNHTLYALKYFFSESICFGNVILQMYVLNKVFNGDFIYYGAEAVRFLNSDIKDMVNPMVRIFPRVASCTFRHFGESGKVVTEHLICVLPVNVVNEKIFLFLWFWFAILAVVSSWAVVFRVATYVIPPLRKTILQARFRQIDRQRMAVLMERGSLGDWFLLHLIAQNVDDVHFVDFVDDLSDMLLGTKKV